MKRARNMTEYFNEYIAPLADVAPIQLETECSCGCGDTLNADEAIRSEFYPDALFATKSCRQRFDETEYPELPYYNDINRNVLGEDL